MWSWQIEENEGSANKLMIKIKKAASHSWFFASISTTDSGTVGITMRAVHREWTEDVTIRFIGLPTIRIYSKTNLYLSPHSLFRHVLFEHTCTLYYHDDNEKQVDAYFSSTARNYTANENK